MVTDRGLEMLAILAGINPNPHNFLGIHNFGGKNVIRAYFPDAIGCSVIYRGKDAEMLMLHRGGIFEAFVDFSSNDYRLKVFYKDGSSKTVIDAYSFRSTLTEEDLYWFNEGTHHYSYRRLGSRTMTIDGIKGTAFAVWAPNAKRASVVGDFNNWDGRHHQMRKLGCSGVWEIFIPELNAGEKYKYELFDANESIRLKSDPYAIYFEGAPNNASVIHSIDDYAWNDSDWITKRSQSNCKKEAISIYEVHIDSWRRVLEDNNRPLTYIELAHQLADYVKETGFTHVEFMPVAEHPFLGSWGYQVTGFFAPTHRYGKPEDFMYLVDHLHQNNIGVIIDWVPGHFPKDEFALAKFDGTALYEHDDSRKGEHPDWGTLIFNYGRYEVINFLIGSALSWFDRFHIDGLRVDAVASMLYLDYSRQNNEWIPNQFGGKENIEAIEFLRTVNDLIHKYYPGAITIAEESTAFGRVSHSTSAYGLGFDFKWNMGWMHDALSFCANDPIHRKYHHNKMTFGMLYQYSENFISVFSHDEVVHGKGSLVTKMGSWYLDDKISTLRALYCYMWGWPGKKTLFMGSEFAQVAEWNYKQSLDWHLLEYNSHNGVKQLIKDLNTLYKSIPFLAEYDNDGRGFEWIDPDDCDNSVLSFIRKNPNTDDFILVISNFTPVLRQNYRLGIPKQSFYKEILNSNSSSYNGQNYGNLGGVHSDNIPSHNKPNSVKITLPPLSTIILKPM